MLNYVWIVLIGASIVFAAVTGSLPETAAAMTASAADAVTMGIGLVGIYAFWQGLLSVAEGVGALEGLRRVLGPVLGRLFPDACRDRETARAIAVNMAANMLGMGNAATPSGIRAVGLMKKGETAHDELILFTAINASSVQIIPTTVIGIRAALGSRAPADIIPAALTATVISTLTAIVLCKGAAFCSKRFRRR
ncbi:MAG: hypothetical protein KIG36_04985 [Eubacteriales bacterium]|nr:hypothetical protein [Eubacteriales bacterium]